MGTLSRDFGQVCWQMFGCPADGLLSTPHIDVLVYDRRVTHVSAPSTRNQRWNAQHSKQSCGWYAQGGSAPVQACNRQMPQQSRGLQSFLSATQRIVVEAALCWAEWPAVASLPPRRHASAASPYSSFHNTCRQETTHKAASDCLRHWWTLVSGHGTAPVPVGVQHPGASRTGAPESRLT